MDASISLGRSRPARSETTTSPMQPADALHGALVASGGDSLASGALLDWHASAPRNVLRAAEANDAAAAWKAWSRYLHGRLSLRERTRTGRGKGSHKRKSAKQRQETSDARPASIWQSFGKRSPLLWGLPSEAEPRRTAALITMLATGDRALRRTAAPSGAWSEILDAWLGEMETAGLAGRAMPGSPISGSSAAVRGVEALAWCYALPMLVSELPAAQWRRLFEFLVQAANDAAALRLEDDPLAHQLWAGELAVALATLLPEIKTSRALFDSGRRSLSRGLVDLLNGEGLVAWDDLGIARGLLACWTRAGMLRARLSKGSWSSEASGQYAWFVTASLRLSRRDGSQLLAPQGNRTAQHAKLDVELLQAAVALGGDRADRRLLAILLGRNVSGNAAKRSEKKFKPRGWDDKRLPQPSYHCEWSGISLLRNDWQRGGTRLAMAFGAAGVQIELDCGRDVLLAGEWTAEVQLDGRTIPATGPWEEACWITDRWVDYVELRQTLADGLVLQRHIVLPRQDDFLLVADAVVGHGYRPAHEGANGSASAERPTISLRMSVPLGSAVEFTPESETRDATLAVERNGARKAKGVILPLALPEWRADHRPGAMNVGGSVDAGSVQRGGAIELTQMGRGTSIFAPLFIDLNAQRAASGRTWRQLTVAEDRKIQSGDRAAGFRIQSGYEQWLVYRSLTPRGNRSLLGHNLSTEFLVARFEPTGEVDALVEIG